MDVAVVGTGHVGLVTSVSLASIGHEVVGADSDHEKVALLQNGVSPFFEPGLDPLLQDEMANGRLSFASDVGAAIPNAEVVFLCVGTPPRADGEASLVAVEKAARVVARHATRDGVVVEKSTVPAGTADRVERILKHERPDLRLDVASNPEFLSEGRAVEDALNPYRILVGARSEAAFETLRRLYGPLIENGRRLIETDIQTAEIAKHVCNAFLAMKISFANAVARICERAGADVVGVADVMGADPRIGRAFLDAGLGYGGYCFPKDLLAFEKLVTKLGYSLPLLSEIARINDEAVEETAAKVREGLWNLEDKRVALLGLSFKPGTDDVRFSPGLALARRLLDGGARIVAYDPRALANAKAELPELEVASDPYDAAADAHCVVLCTEWEEFRSLELPRLAEVMAYPLIVDGRNILDPAQVHAAGFTYYPTGRPPVLQ